MKATTRIELFLYSVCHVFHMTRYICSGCWSFLPIISNPWLITKLDNTLAVFCDPFILETAPYLPISLEVDGLSPINCSLSSRLLKQMIFLMESFPFFWRWKGERMDWHKDEALTLRGAVRSLHLCWICFWEILRSLERKSALNQRELKLAKRRPQVYLLTAGIYFKFAQRKISNCVPSNRAGPVLQIWELCPIVIREA